MASWRTLTQILVIIVSFLLLTKPNIIEADQSNFTSGDIGNGSCIESERKALLEFRKGLKDPSGWLSSWTGQDCCNWTGVSCSNKTGNVVKLDLKSHDVCNSEAVNNRSCLGGTLSPSLLNLTYLSYLDMSGNNFGGNSIPEFIGSLKNLRYLDLSSASFNGKLPSSLGNLSNLEYIDLSMYLIYPWKLWASDLNWLSGLSSLQYLNLGAMNLSKVEPTKWMQSVNVLPSLKELHLSNCDLNGISNSLAYVNFTSLEVFDLAYNNFSSSSLPNWLFNISTLKEVDLYNCELKGSIPKVSRGSLCNLHTLDLSSNKINGGISEFIEALAGCSNNSLDYLDLSSNNLEGNLPEPLGLLKYLKTLHLNQNSFSGSLPGSIGNLSSLNWLDLSFNLMNGTILESIGQLSSLYELNLYGNSWGGVITENHFKNLSSLSSFAISSIGKSVEFSLRPDWIPPFKLNEIAISGCQLGPAFPSWLRTQTAYVSQLTLSGAGISGTIPDWFWNLTSQLWWIDLSDNQLTGQLPSSVSFGYVVGAWIDLGFNLLEGSIPLWPNVTNLSLRNNFFSGPIPSNIGQAVPNMQNLDLSRNFLNGSIPASINNMGKLSFLDLSSNNLSGSIPNQLQGLKRLMVLDLSNNNLSGSVPTSLCSLPSLFFLNLRSNNLSGDVSTLNCSGLVSLDLGENRFSGRISDLVSDMFFFISHLGLRGNMLTGNIPEQLCKFPSLHIIDLAHNKLSGTIPECLGNLEAFTYFAPLYNQPPSAEHISFSPYVEIVSKGRQNEYSKIIPLVNVIDLSSNDLVGAIPDHFTKLSALGTLNLSSNHLSGQIPANIGSLQRLETLDLSHNNLFGPIPPTMSSMTFLNYLNLSFNNLSGQIPRGNQFQTFNDPSIYEGNVELCGPPLSTSCNSSSTPSNGNGDEHREQDSNGGSEGDEYRLGLFISMGLGFAIGFWVVCGSLVIKRSWRQAYFKYVDDLKDRLFLLIAVTIVRCQRKFGSIG